MVTFSISMEMTAGFCEKLFQFAKESRHGNYIDGFGTRANCSAMI